MGRVIHSSQVDGRFSGNLARTAFPGRQDDRMDKVVQVFVFQAVGNLACRLRVKPERDKPSQVADVGSWRRIIQGAGRIELNGKDAPPMPSHIAEAILMLTVWRALRGEAKLRKRLQGRLQ